MVPIRVSVIDGLQGIGYNQFDRFCCGFNAQKDASADMVALKDLDIVSKKEEISCALHA